MPTERELELRRQGRAWRDIPVDAPKVTCETLAHPHTLNGPHVCLLAFVVEPSPYDKEGA